MDSVGAGVAFAHFVLAGFDIVQSQVAYVSGGDGSGLVEIATDATRDAIRHGELLLTRAAFHVDGVRGTEPAASGMGMSV